jgi:hypothetical protein
MSIVKQKNKSKVLYLLGMKYREKQVLITKCIVVIDFIKWEFSSRVGF